MGRPDLNAYRVTLELMKRFVDTIMPVGGSLWWAVDSPATPAIGSGLSIEWKECDGAAISRTTYAALFALIGTTWGIGDGSTTFNLPDLKLKVAGMAGSGWSVGATKGAATHTLIQSELPDVSLAVTDTGHAHDIQADTTGDPDHVHTSAGIVPEAPDPGDFSFGVVATDAAATGISVSLGGSDTPLPIVQATAVGRWIIRVK